MLGGRRVGVAFAAVLSIFSLYTLYFILSSPVMAQYGQYGQPVPSKTILIDKMVGKSGVTKGGTTSDFTDNFSPSDPRFSPGQEILFRLTVKNTSSVTLTNVEVKDFVPDFLEVLEAPRNFDKATRTLTFNAGDFGVDEEKEYFLKMRFVSQDQLPSDKGLICLLNKAQASASEVFDEDTSQFCVEKQVIGAVQVPSAGPEAGLLLLGFNALAAGAGFWLRKKK